MLIFWLLLGLLGALSLIAVARIKPDYEIQFLGVGLAIAPLIYVGFALVGSANSSWIVTELLGVGLYSVFVVLGLRYSSWWLILGWLAHPLWDVGLHLVGAGTTYTPVWYAIVCISLDLGVAVYLLVRTSNVIPLNQIKIDATEISP
jgi:hypothetical protein